MNTELSERCLKGVQKSRPIPHFIHFIKTFVLTNTHFRSISRLSRNYFGNQVDLLSDRLENPDEFLTNPD